MVINVQQFIDKVRIALDEVARGIVDDFGSDFDNSIRKLLQLYPTLCDIMDCSCQAPLSMGFSGKKSGVGCHALLQGIFQTQGWNPHLLHLLHCRRVLYY